MSPLDQLDLAAREWAEANREFGRRLRADDRIFGYAVVREQETRKAYEAALEACRVTA